jgi:hypothetical protein
LKKNSLFKNLSACAVFNFYIKTMSDDLPSLDQIITTCKETNNEDMLPGASNIGGEQTSTSIAAPTAVANNIMGELINLIYKKKSQ